MKIVVTGATGHVGSVVVAELLSRGHTVVAASRSGSLPAVPFGRPRLQSPARALPLDLRSDAAVEILAAELGPDVALVHLGAWHPPATAATGAAERGELIATNVYGSMRAFEAARRTRGGVSAIVYASSFEVYGEIPDAGPISEVARTHPLTDYGATKLSGEDHLLAFAYEEQTRVVALRMPAIYGPGEHTPRALPNFLRSVAKGERPIIYGDGADLRDQLHVADAARAVALAVERPAQGIFNVADGEMHSIAELARTALLVSGMDGQPEFRARAKPRRDWHMSIAKARTELGFEPQVTLATGMSEQLAWLATARTTG